MTMNSIRPRFRTLTVLGFLLGSLAVEHVPLARAQTLPGTLTGTYTFDGTSGTTAYTGDATLSGSVRLGSGFFAEYLVVGGGGAGGGSGVGTQVGAGGGGAGGMLSNVGGSLLQFPASDYRVTVGKGGASSSYPYNISAAKGDDSSIGSLIVATGGGGGGNDLYDGANGGSGGGAGYGTGSGFGISGQGNAGGGTIGPGGGGGGGAGGVGTTGTSFNGVPGGPGVANTITGSSVVYAAGGHGGSSDSGGRFSDDGAINSGNGGGGANHWTTAEPPVPGAGGSGIVVVRYAGSPMPSSNATTDTTTVAGFTIQSWTTVGSGTLSLADLDARLGVVIPGVLSGSGTLAWAGPGSLTLGGANTFSGATSVDAGSLLIGSGASLPSALITVNAGATLGGLGTVADVVFSGSSSLAFNALGPLVSSGSMTFASGFGIANLADVDWNTLVQNVPYTIIDTSSQIFSAASIDNFGAGNAASVGNGRYAYFQSSGHDLQVMVVPEPTTLVLVATGLAALAFRMRCKTPPHR